MAYSISVVIPAWNEEKNIIPALSAAKRIFDQYTHDYEFLIFNDGSKDQTGLLAEQWALGLPQVRVIHEDTNQGLAAITRQAIQIASKQYLTWYPGDHSIQAESLAPILRAVGHADIVVAYMANQRQRTYSRRVLSQALICVLNALFFLRIRYYNGPSVYPVKLLRSIAIRSEGYGIFAEILTRLLKLNHTCRELPFIHYLGTDRYSRSLRFKNFYLLLRTILILICDIYVRHCPRGLMKNENPSEKPEVFSGAHG